MNARIAAGLRRLAAVAALVWATQAGAAIAPETIRDLAFGESDARGKAIAAIVASGDAQALPLLQAVLDGEIKTAGEDRVLQVKGDAATDLLTGKSVTPVPDNLDDLVVNNRMRRELGTALAALKLATPDRATRLAAAKELQSTAEDDALPAISAAIAKESDPEIKGLLVLTQASIQLSSTDQATRLAAVKALTESDSGSTKTLLLGLLERKNGKYVEPDDELRAEAERSLRAVESRLAKGEMVARIFSGISLGTILLLAALGLAITYGLMGVINMAHGELIMIGAYATYVVQNMFRTYFPASFDAYLICAIPVAFAASAIVGMVLERTVIRWLYG
ncbi:MAG TPA: urea ABC transporter permease subunit UrtB, partial [Casimicrobiaceae bacterium]